MITPQVKAVILLALLAAGFYNSWTAQQWRLKLRQNHDYLS
jgi:hypothetical protein